MTGIGWNTPRNTCALLWFILLLLAINSHGRFSIGWQLFFCSLHPADGDSQSRLFAHDLSPHPPPAPSTSHPSTLAIFMSTFIQYSQLSFHLYATPAAWELDTTPQWQCGDGGRPHVHVTAKWLTHLLISPITTQLHPNCVQSRMFPEFPLFFKLITDSL